MMHVWCHYEFRITNMKFALVTHDLTHFQRDFEWDLRQAIFKLILVINGWNCTQTNVMDAYGSVYIGSDNYLNQCSQRSMSPCDVTGSQRFISLMILYSTVYSDADQRKYQSSASLAVVREFTGDQCMTYPKDQWRGNKFQLMTSSWSIHEHSSVVPD